MIARDRNRSIWKWPLEVTDRQVIMMPVGADALCVQLQQGAPQLWALVQTDAPTEQRAFYVVGTGHHMPAAATAFIGTFQLADGALVFHVFAGDR